MKTVNSLLASVLAALLLVSGPAAAADADQARERVAQAQDTLAEVKQKTDGWALWKSTKKILGNAEQSLEQGDYAAAVEAADRVIFQANKGLAQYREEQQEYAEAADSASGSGKLKEDAWTQGES